MSKLAARLPLPVQAATLRAALRLPRPARRLIAGKPVAVDGQTLALEAQLLLRLQKMTEIRLSDGTPAEARANLEDSAQLAVDRTFTGVTTDDLVIPTGNGSLPARLYRPDAVREPGPLLVFYHGGGWVVGSIETHDQAARFLAKHAGMRVLSVGYRLAPEAPFPAAVEDAVAAFDHAHKHADELGADQGRIAVGGDSAGGNLAAVVAQQTTQRGGPAPTLQVLIYPEVDFTVRRRSRQLFAEGFFLSDDDMNWFEGHYVPEGTDKGDPRLSPLRSLDLTGLPPAYIVTAGFDPLRDAGEAYAGALEQAGVPVVLRRHEDLIHGFLNFTELGARFREATLEIASALRTGLALART